MAVEDSSARRSWTQRYIPRPSGSGRRFPGSVARSAAGVFRRPHSGPGRKADEITFPVLIPAKHDVAPIFPASAPASRSGSPTSFLIAPPSYPPIRSSFTLSRSATMDARPVSHPFAPKRWSSSFLLTSFAKASQNSDRTAVPPERPMDLATSDLRQSSDGLPAQSGRPSDAARSYGSSIGKSWSSMIGGLSSLSLSRTTTRESMDERDRGRSMLTGKVKPVKSASHVRQESEGASTWSRSRSQSPFTLRRYRSRVDTSPTPQPLALGASDVDLLDSESILPRNAFTYDNSDDEVAGDTTDADDLEGESSSDEFFDPVTERNTERNALITTNADTTLTGLDGEEPDPLGEGVNVVLPPEPYFPLTLNSHGTLGSAGGKRNLRRRKTSKHQEPLPHQTSRPIFQKDRCTVSVIQGDPEGKLGNRKKRLYVVASDLSEESRYAIEWGIGTVLRDGDEMLIVTVMENEARVDPAVPNTGDKRAKLRAQQERQGMAYILVRQVTSLLQRTRLNVKVSCQSWHAKNMRHMLLDIVDYTEPTMLIVGSRGLGKLNGILLGSTSHYLIQKCSVPVMVARRRLKRPPRRSAHLSTDRAHVSLAEAGIDRVLPTVDADVEVMHKEMFQEDIRRVGGPGSRDYRRGIVDQVPLELGDGVVDDNDDDDDGEPQIKIT